MPLTKPRRFILVQSKTNSNANEDNMEPYHVSTFRRSTSMPPLPKLSSSSVIRPSVESVPIEKKNSRLNIEVMKKKSARISIRLSNVFRLATQTIDEGFNFEEERFRAIDKFVKAFLKHVLNSIEVFRDILLTQVKIAEDFEELLLDHKTDFVKEFVRSKRFVIEKIWIEFTNHMQSNVIDPLNILLQYFISPSNLISKRHKKLLDYDRAYSTYEKLKDPSLKQTKYQLDRSKENYEHLNNRLLEDLPVLYESTCQLLCLCIPSYLIGYLRLIEQIRLHLRWALDQTRVEQLSWPGIQQRFDDKNTIVSKTFFDLNITTKNSFGKSRYQSLPEKTTSISRPPPIPPRSDLHRLKVKAIYYNEIPPTLIYVALYDFQSTLDGVLSLQVGEQIKVLRRLDDDRNEDWWYVERMNNSDERGYVPANYIQPIDHHESTEDRI